jgi:hypothetical protein
VYVIEQLALHMAGWAEVNVAVLSGPTRALAGVRVLQAPGLSARELPEAEVVIGGLAQPEPERVLALPAGKGRPLFFFQGYGTPGNAGVSAMLERRPGVLAVSSFLAGRAQERGCEVELIRPGLDRVMFAAGRPCGQRAAVVAMMTHGLGWKATEDGLGALARVRAAVPEVELRLFGARGEAAGAMAEIGAEHLGELSRAGVGELLRETAVFVCPSLEEGLGLPGLEALACGAALACTDTKGSRDYAIQGQTALVTPPGRPELLAESAIALLRDGELRGRLAERGRERVLATYPPWQEAARAFHHAVGRLLGRGGKRAEPTSTPPTSTPPKTTPPTVTGPRATARRAR